MVFAHRADRLNFTAFGVSKNVRGDIGYEVRTIDLLHVVVPRMKLVNKKPTVELALEGRRFDPHWACSAHDTELFKLADTQL